MDRISFDRNKKLHQTHLKAILQIYRCNSQLSVVDVSCAILQICFEVYPFLISSSSTGEIQVKQSHDQSSKLSLKPLLYFVHKIVNRFATCLFLDATSQKRRQLTFHRSNILPVDCITQRKVSSCSLHHTE